MEKLPRGLGTPTLAKDVTAALKDRWPRICQRFAIRVRDIVPSSDNLSDEEISAHIPFDLTDLIACLKSPSSPSNPTFGRITRAMPETDLGRYFATCAMIRELILEEVVHGMDRLLSGPEISRINHGVDSIIATMVTAWAGGQHDRLRQAVESQNKFLSAMTHDLRGSLNGAVLTMELLERRLEGEAHLADVMEDLRQARLAILQSAAKIESARKQQGSAM